jgi:hypothetical protein
VDPVPYLGGQINREEQPHPEGNRGVPPPRG